VVAAGGVVPARGGSWGVGGAGEPFEMELAGDLVKTTESPRVGARVEEPLVEVDDPVPDRAGSAGGGAGTMRRTGSVSEWTGIDGRGGMAGRSLADFGRVASSSSSELVYVESDETSSSSSVA